MEIFANTLYNLIVNKKTKMKLKSKIVNIFIIITLLFLVTLPSDVIAASTGEIYLSPSSSSLVIGSQLNLALRVNPGTPIDTVQATVNFNPSLISFVSSSSSGSPFSCLSDTTTSSSVAITCYITGSSVSSDSLIKNLTFNTVATGSTSLSITNAETALSGTPYYPSVAGSSVTINPQPVSQPSSPSPSKTYTYTPPVAAAPTAPKVVLQPINLNLKFLVGQIYSLKAIIDISSSANASYLIKYGQSQTNLSSTTASTQPTNKTTISLDNLSPKTVYYYQVVAIDSNNITQTFKISSFTTNGVSLNLQLLSANYQPISNTVVHLSGQNTAQKTDANGKVTFYNLVPGTQSFYFYSNGKKYSQQFFVPIQPNGVNLLPQNQTIVLGNFKLASSLTKPASLVNLVMLTVVILLVVLLIYRAKIK